MRRPGKAWSALPLLLWLPLASADAAITPRLLDPPADAGRGPGDPIRVSLDGVSREQLSRLYLLLDGVDITSFASVQDQLVTVVLPTPLELGEHRLELVELGQNGETSVVAAWPVVVQRQGFFDDAALRANLTQNADVRIADHDIADLPDAVQGDGAAEIQGLVGRGSLELEAHAPFLWSTQRDANAGDYGAVGPFLIQGRAGPAFLRLGHHQLGPPSLTMNGFMRRGVSLSLRSQRLRSSATGFSLHGSPVQGFRGGLGVDDEDDRVSGVLLESRPVEHELGTLDVSATLLDGRAPQVGSPLSGVVGAPDVLDGTSWGLRARGTLFGDRISVLGEYAASETRFDRAPTADGEAHWIDVDVAPFPELRAGRYPVTWSLGFSESRVDPLYLSPANPGLPPGRKQRSGESYLDVAGATLQVYGGRWEDDVVDRDIEPRMRADGWGADLSFTPAVLLEGERRGPLRWLGMPSVDGSFYREDLSPVSVPASFATPGLLPDSLVQTATAGLGFQYDRFGWRIQYLLVDTHDRTPAQLDSTLHQIGLQATLQAGDRLYLSPYVQADEETRRSSPDMRNLLAGIGIGARLIPERLDANADVSFVRTTASDDSTEVDTLVCHGSLDLTALRPRENRPGLVLSLLGSYQNVRDEVFSQADLDAYQVFLRATVSFPAAIGGR